MCGRWREEVCMRVLWRTIAHMSVRMFDVLCQTRVRMCGMQNMQILPEIHSRLCWWDAVFLSPLSRQRAGLVVCSHRGDTGVEVSVPSDECSSHCLIPQHQAFLANAEFARFPSQIRSPCRTVPSLDCKNVQCIISLLFIWGGATRMSWHCVYTSVRAYAFVVASSVRVVWVHVQMQACM